MRASRHGLPPRCYRCRLTTSQRRCFATFFGLTCAFTLGIIRRDGARSMVGSFVVNPLISGRAKDAVGNERSRRVRRRALEDFIDVAFVVNPKAAFDAVAAVGPVGPLYFFGSCVLAVVLLLPITPFLLSAGYLFGVPVGIGVMLLAVCSAASVSFVLARTFLREPMEAVVSRNPRLKNLTTAVQREGFKIISLLRLSPVMPFALTNYALGLSGVAFEEYILATAVGYLPWTVGCVYLSATCRDLLSDSGEVPDDAYLIGVVITVGLLKVVSDISEKAIADAATASADVDVECLITGDCKDISEKGIADATTASVDVDARVS